MKVAIVTHNFPHPKFPQSGTFVKKLADGMSEVGAEVLVYALVSKTNLFIRRGKDLTTISFNDNIRVKYIEYLSFGNISFAGFSTAELGYFLSSRGLNEQFRTDLLKGGKPDVLYGKFLLSGGRKVANLSKQYSIPAVADLGESTLLQRLTPKSIRRARDIVSNLKGVVCVSPRLRSEVIQLGMNPNRVLMLPNGIDTEKFFPIDMYEARNKLGLPTDKKIVIFVGHFIHRKGPNRVLQAIESLPIEYYGVFLGEGPVVLESERLLFKGRVSNDALNTWLNAADVFCLPTLAEGSCNAIEEARAVGLPVVTSNISDITDFESAKEYVLVDPLDISDICRGIQKASTKSRFNYQSAPLSNKERSTVIVNWLQKLLTTEV